MFWQVFESLPVNHKTEKYETFLSRYNDLASDNDKMKSALTDIAFSLAQQVWVDLPAESRGDLFFCIGGVNDIIPFSATAVKNEIVVYMDAVGSDAKRIGPEGSTPIEGAYYDSYGSSVAALDLSCYDKIYMDFNGSMAFFSDKWKQRLSEPNVAAKVKSVF